MDTTGSVIFRITNGRCRLVTSHRYEVVERLSGCQRDDNQIRQSMDYTAMGTFIGGVGTLVVACIGATLVAMDVRLRSLQIKEGSARTRTAINMDVEVDLVPCAPGSKGKPLWVLETRVTLTNVGRDPRCIPAVYISARAMTESHKEDDALSARFYEVDFNKLPRCGDLSVPRNTARIADAMSHIGPDERETLVRYDLLNSEFLEKYPVLVVAVDAFTSATTEIGTSDDNTFGPLRNAWLDFMNGQNRDDFARHEMIVLGRTRIALNDIGVKAGERVLLQPDGNVDMAHTKKFLPVLRSTWEHTARKTVVLHSAIGEPKNNGA